VIVVHLDRVHDREQRLAVLLDLRALMAQQRVFDSQLVQAELFRHHGEFFRTRVLERDPDEALGPRNVFADVFDRDVGEFAAILVGRAIDQHDVDYLEDSADWRAVAVVPDRDSVPARLNT
jgi:hypothetical protein